MLECDLIEVKVGVFSVLPIEGITIILGNSLGSSHVKADRTQPPGLTSSPCFLEQPETCQSGPLMSSAPAC